MKNTPERSFSSFVIIGTFLGLAIAAAWEALTPTGIADPPEVVTLQDAPSSQLPVEPPKLDSPPERALSCDEDTAPLVTKIAGLRRELLKTKRHLAGHHADVHNLKHWLAGRDVDNEWLHRRVGSVCYGVDP